MYMCEGGVKNAIVIFVYKAYPLSVYLYFLCVSIAKIFHSFEDMCMIVHVHVYS